MAPEGCSVIPDFVEALGNASAMESQVLCGQTSQLTSGYFLQQGLSQGSIKFYLAVGLPSCLAHQTGAYLLLRPPYPR